MPHQLLGMVIVKLVTIPSNSIRRKIANDIDKLLLEVKSFDMLLDLLRIEGYQIKTGKDISLKAIGAKRYIRLNSINNGEYAKDIRIKDITIMYRGCQKLPIKNVDIIYDEQDCEMNAAKRLLKRIKRNSKKLQICISAYALYFNESMIKLIESLHWKYMHLQEGVRKRSR